jgi:transketolase
MTDKKPISIREAYGNALAKLGETNEKIVVLDADLAKATMTGIFAKKFPERFYDFGIAEANMMCAAVGLAFECFIPFASTFGLFGAGRADEQIRNSAAYPHANIKFGLSHSGLAVGEDGGSHQAIEDIALMREIPGMTILVPCDPLETEKAVEAALKINGPVFIRTARPVANWITDEQAPFTVGKADVFAEGKDVALFGTGLMVPQCLKAADLLKKDGISAAVLNFHTIKPFDSEAALSWANKTGAVVTAEDHSVIGGLGSATAEALATAGAACRFTRLGEQDRFGQSGSIPLLYKEYGIDAEGIAASVEKLLK